MAQFETELCVANIHYIKYRGLEPIRLMVAYVLFKIVDWISFIKYVSISFDMDMLCVSNVTPCFKQPTFSHKVM